MDDHIVPTLEIIEIKNNYVLNEIIRFTSQRFKRIATFSSTVTTFVPLFIPQNPPLHMSTYFYFLYHIFKVNLYQIYPNCINRYDQFVAAANNTLIVSIIIPRSDDRVKVG